MDEKGVWRCAGRLLNADLPYSVKNPVLLPRNHPLTLLIIREAHERVFHNGAKETITEIQAKFWIPRVRSLVGKWRVHHLNHQHLHRFPSFG